MSDNDIIQFTFGKLCGDLRQNQHTDIIQTCDKALLYNLSISDFNECRNSEHKCEGLCENTAGSYVCKCEAGFLLNPDGRSCDGKCSLIAGHVSEVCDTRTMQENEVVNDRV